MTASYLQLCLIFTLGITCYGFIVSRNEGFRINCYMFNTLNKQEEDIWVYLISRQLGSMLIL